MSAGATWVGWSDLDVSTSAQYVLGELLFHLH